jgi:hypothetical protein
MFWMMRGGSHAGGHSPDLSMRLDQEASSKEERG